MYLEVQSSHVIKVPCYHLWNGALQIWAPEGSYRDTSSYCSGGSIFPCLSLYTAIFCSWFLKLILVGVQFNCEDTHYASNSSATLFKLKLKHDSPN